MLNFRVNAREITSITTTVLFVQADSNTQRIQFDIGSSESSYAIQNLNAFLIYRLPGSSTLSCKQLSTPVLADNRITTYWEPTNTETVNSGKFTFQVVFCNSNSPLSDRGSITWATKVTQVTIPESLLS